MGRKSFFKLITGGSVDEDGGSSIRSLALKFIIWILIAGFIIMLATFLIMSLHRVSQTGSYIGNTGDPIVAKTDPTLRLADGLTNKYRPIVARRGDSGFEKSIGPGAAFTISFWVYINDSAYKHGHPRTVLMAADTTLLEGDRFKELAAATAANPISTQDQARYVVAQKNAQRWANPLIIFNPINHQLFVRFRFTPGSGGGAAATTTSQFIDGDNNNGNSPYNLASAPIPTLVPAASTSNADGYSTTVEESSQNIRNEFFNSEYQMALRNIFPNRWTHVIITKPATSNQIQFYTDGKLTNTFDLGDRQVAPIIDAKTEVILAPLNGFGGFLSRVKFIAEETSAAAATQLYLEGPIQTSSFMKNVNVLNQAHRAITSSTGGVQEYNFFQVFTHHKNK